MLNKTHALKLLNTSRFGEVTISGRVQIRRDDGYYTINDGWYVVGEGMDTTTEYRYVGEWRSFAEAYKDAVTFVKGEHWRQTARRIAAFPNKP